MEKKSTSGILNVMQKLDKALGNKAKGTGGKDFKDLNEARKKATIKLKEGKNQIAFLLAPGQDDPFVEWGYHQGLQEVSYYSVPCDGHNKNEKCYVCDVVDSLKKEDFKKNRHIWAPIEQKIEHYAPIINMETTETIAEGPKWLRLPKSVMFTILDWLRNLEEGEVPFYDESEPQRIIITYDKTEVPAKQYSLDKKNMRPFTEQQLADWKSAIQPISTYIFSKKQNDIKKLIDEYFARIEDTIDSLDKSGAAAVASEAEAEVSPEIEENAKKKLQGLKMKN